MTGAGMSTHERTFRFLDLPAEIRCFIYSYLLKGRCTIELEIGTSKYRTRGRASDTLYSGRPAAVISAQCHPEITAAIIFVNRLTYCEAISLLYSESMFGAKDPGPIKIFAKSIGMSVQHLTQVSVGDPNGRYMRRAFKPEFKAMIHALAEAKNLKVLRLSQAFFDPGVARLWQFVTSAEVLLELMPLLKALNRARRDGKGKTRLASELLSVPILYVNNEVWERYHFEADLLQAELKKLLDETVFS